MDSRLDFMFADDDVQSAGYSCEGPRTCSRLTTGS